MCVCVWRGGGGGGGGSIQAFYKQTPESRSKKIVEVKSQLCSQVVASRSLFSF